MESTEPLDLVVLGGTVLTPDAIAAGIGGGRRAIGIRSGVIVAIAPEHEAREAGWLDTAVRVADFGEAAIVPGLVDAHIHPIMGLSLTRGIDLSGIRDRQGVRSAIAEYVAGADPAQEWILGWGLDPAVFENGEFSNALLDGVDGGRKVFITLFDSHSALASKAAIASAGVRGDERFANGSAIGLDAQGRPSGLLYEFAAQQLVSRLIPEQTFEERVGRLAEVLDGMASTGLVAGHMLDLVAEDSFELLDELERRQELPITLRVSPSVFPGFTDADLERHLAVQQLRGRRWHVRGVKLMIDGTIDNGTAWLSHPDTRGESTRSLWLDPAEYQRAVRYFHAHGIPTATHAIGDRGVEFVAETLASLEPSALRHRIEHIETIPDHVVELIQRSGAAASMQPTHCTLYVRADHTDNWSQRLGRERADQGWRTKDLRERGVTLTLGSDWPIAPWDPRGIIASAQLRRPPGRQSIEPVHAEQGLTAREALAGYTTEYWRSVGEDGGRIEVGARADLAVFELNPLTARPDDFADAGVLATVVEGSLLDRRRTPEVGRRAEATR